MAGPDLLATYASDGAELIAQYADLWREFLKIGPGKITPNTLAVSPVQDTPGRTLKIDFARSGEPMAILGASSRGAPKTSLFDIYFSGTQTIGRIPIEHGGHQWVILRSRFEVLYLNSLETTVVRQAWRDQIKDKSRAYAGYQFITNLTDPAAKHYPDCHARYCLDSVDEATIKRFYKEGHLGWESRARHGQPQIPSAPIDLVGLLYIILHCHLGTVVDQGWPKKVRAIVEKLPRYRLDADGRSVCTNWYEHSHSTPSVVVPPPLTMIPPGWAVPEPAKSAGWGAKIANREHSEDPHISVYHHDERRWRINLRTGGMMSGERQEIPDELFDAIEKTKQAWRDLWDATYKNNLVGDCTW